MAESAGNPEATGSDAVDMNTAWRDHIPEDLKQEKFWESVPDMPTLVKNYANAQKFIGSSVRVPGEDATPEQVGAFYKKLGRPDDPKGYQIADVQGADKLPADVIEWFKQVAFDEGVPQKAFANILSKYGNLYAGMQGVNADQLAIGAKQTEEILKRGDQWGANYDRNMALARRAVAKLGSEETLDKIERLGLGNDIPFMTLFYQVGRQMAEHGIIPGDVPGVLGVDAAKSRIRELQGKPEYMDPHKPGHKELIQEVQKLYQVAFE